jgi:hypothetical protein
MEKNQKGYCSKVTHFACDHAFNRQNFKGQIIKFASKSSYFLENDMKFLKGSSFC